jgi:hypothetical protein
MTIQPYLPSVDSWHHPSNRNSGICYEPAGLITTQRTPARQEHTLTWYFRVMRARPEGDYGVGGQCTYLCCILHFGVFPSLSFLLHVFLLLS